MDNPFTPRTEKTPHAGNLPLEARETPVNDFDNTTLSEAVESDYIKTPNSPADLIQDGPQMPASLYEGTPPNAPFSPSTSFESSPEKKKSKKNLFISLGATAAAVSIAAGAFFAVKANEPAPQSEPVATAPAEPNEQPSEEVPVEAEPVTPESLVMPNTLTPDQLGVEYIEDHLSTWELMGSTVENRDTYYESGGDFAIIQDIAAKNAELMANATFVENWKDIPSLVTYVTNMQKSNETSLENWFKTSSEPDRNEEPYNRWIEASPTSTPQQNADGSVTLITEATGYNNADKNRAKELDPSTLTMLVQPITFTTTFQNTNGEYKISAIDIVAR